MVPVLLALPIVAVGMLSRVGGSAGEGEPLTATVCRAPFVHALPARGELESARNTEVRCEVRSRNGAWVRILDVVEEGTYVKPGDFLVQLDASSLEFDRNQQIIIVEQAEAQVAKQRAAYESACQARVEFVEGEYAVARCLAERDLMLAKHLAQTARDYFHASEKLVAKGYITEEQFEADRYALESSETTLARAHTRLRILERIKRPKRVADLNSAVAVGKVRLDVAEYTLARQKEMLSDIDEQIAKCRIVAPVAGEVVLAHLHHHGHSHMVAPGELTVQNRALIRLPDPKSMRVKLRLRESHIALVRRGMPVDFVLEAYPNIELRGAVTDVEEYPEEQDWYDSGVKEFAAHVKVETPIAGMRPGLTADVRIHVDHLAEALQIPADAVVSEGDRQFCLVYEHDRIEAREVTLGASNGQSVVINAGLSEGQRVVLQPVAYLGDVDLPSPSQAAPPAAAQRAIAAVGRRP